MKSKADLLYQPMLCEVFEGSAFAEQTHNSLPETKFFFDSLERGAREKRPASAALDAMAQIIQQIIKYDYNIDIKGMTSFVTSTGVQIVLLTPKPADSMNTHDHLAKDAVDEFLAKLTKINGGRNVHTDAQTSSIYAEGTGGHGKVKMLSAISRYLVQEHCSLVTIDNADIDYEDGQANNISDLRRQIHAVARNVQDIYENDPEEARRLFAALPSQPYMSMEHCLAAHTKAYDAHIPTSSDHIMHMIQLEDGIKMHRAEMNALDPVGYH